MFAKATIVALIASLAAAQRVAPVGEPAGNPITRPLNEIVPACKAFTITWQPTTPNTVSLILLRGPSSNVVPLATIATEISNSGSFVWTPSASLEADDSRYGLQLVDDITGQYQYSTQFGISKGADCNLVVSSSAAPIASSYGSGYPAASSAPVSSVMPASSTMSKALPVSYRPSSTSMANNATTIVTKTSSMVLSTGSPAYNTSISIIMPSGSMAVPSGLRPNATGSAIRSPLPESTGAASSLKAGLGLVGAVAAMALML